MTDLTPKRFIDELFQDIDGHFTLFTLDRETGRHATAWTTTPTDLLLLADFHTTHCCWFGVASRVQQLAEGRGGGDDCGHIGGLWIDVDVSGPAHDKPGLPADRSAATKLIKAFPLPPTVVLDSGAGYQAWWLFTEPLPAKEAEPLLDRWHDTWFEYAQRQGVTIDNVFDVARIMRLPGTHNTKAGVDKPVIIKRADYSHRFGVDDIDGAMPELAPRPPRVERPKYEGDTRPGDDYNHRHDGQHVFQDAGWQFHHISRSDGAYHYTRPGKNVRDGSSATVYPDGHIYVYSSDATIPVRAYDPFGLYTHLNHNGDFETSSAELRKQGYGKQPDTATGIRIGATLPTDFWDKRPELAHIRTAALSRMISPDAVLACVLARVVALTHHQIVLPAIVGRLGSLNLFVSIIAPPGVGKGSAIDTATELIPPPPLLNDLAGEFREISVGSGEGLVRAFFKRKKEPNPETGKPMMMTVQTCWNAAIRIDEGDMLARLAQRQDQTTMTVIRQAWSGERLGASYADEDKNLHLAPHTYRLSIVMGVQPELGRFLLDDTAAGTPQRFTFLTGHHPDIPQPDNLPNWPGPLPWKLPTRPPTAHGLTEIDVPPAVAYQLRAAQHQRVTGDQNDTYGGHAGLRQLKLAAALALLNQRTHIEETDWNLAQTIETTSTIVRTTMAQTITNEDTAKARAGDKRAITRQLAVADALETTKTTAVERVAQVLVRRIRKLDGQATTRDLRHAINSRDRHLFTDAVDYAIWADWLTLVDNCLNLGEMHEEVVENADAA